MIVRKPDRNSDPGQTGNFMDDWVDISKLIRFYHQIQKTRNRIPDQQIFLLFLSCFSGHFWSAFLVLLLLAVKRSRTTGWSILFLYTLNSFHDKNNTHTKKIVVGICSVYRGISSKTINLENSKFLHSKKLNWKLVQFSPQNSTNYLEGHLRQTLT